MFYSTPIKREGWRATAGEAFSLTMNHQTPDYVILLHGLLRSSASMRPMEKSLQAAGYKTINFRYPSRKYKIEQLAADVVPKALAMCPKNSSVNFVTHSLGGILVRQYLHTHSINNLNHVVMLGPPNKGSEVVDFLANFPGFKAINGPAGVQLGTGAMSLPNRLGRADFSLGIIAGTKTINLILSALLSSLNDGKVSVENTKLDGMKDHIALPVTHSFMMKNKEVINQVLHFLKQGKFNGKN